MVLPATGKPITAISIGTEKDVDNAVEVARKAYKTSWGLKVPGAERGKLLNKLADLVESNIDELSALESLNVGESHLFSPTAVAFDVILCQANRLACPNTWILETPSRF